MKKLSISLVIALICISMFSCDEKSVISPQNEDCKITGISSHSGASSSTVTVYGKNLSKDSELIVKFGNQNAEILSRTDDSITVKVPNNQEGIYDFHVISKARGELYITKYDLVRFSNVVITKCSSTLGFANSLVIIYGQNLCDNSNISVKFGNQSAEILLRTKDSLVVKVPNLPNGLYDISVISTAKTFVFPTKYEITTLDFSKFKSYIISGTGFQVEYNVFHHWKERVWEDQANSTEYEQQFGFSAKNKDPIEIVQTKTNSYQIEDEYHQKIDQITNYIKFVFNPKTNQFISINIDCTTYAKEYNSVYTHETKRIVKFDLNDMNYTIDVTNQKLDIELKGKEEISAKLLHFNHQWYYGGHSNTEDEYSNWTYTVKRFLWNDNKGKIIIRFSM